MTIALQKYKKKKNHYLKYAALQIIYNLDAFFVDYIAMQGFP